jgi:hypothetical protein
MPIRSETDTNTSAVPATRAKRARNSNAREQAGYYARTRSAPNWLTRLILAQVLFVTPPGRGQTVSPWATPNRQGINQRYIDPIDPVKKRLRRFSSSAAIRANASHSHKAICGKSEAGALVRSSSSCSKAELSRASQAVAPARHLG